MRLSNLTSALLCTQPCEGPLLEVEAQWQAAMSRMLRYYIGIFDDMLRRRLNLAQNTSECCLEIPQAGIADEATNSVLLDVF